MAIVSPLSKHLLLEVKMANLDLVVGSSAACSQDSILECLFSTNNKKGVFIFCALILLLPETKPEEIEKNENLAAP